MTSFDQPVAQPFAARDRAHVPAEAHREQALVPDADPARVPAADVVVAQEVVAVEREDAIERAEPFERRRRLVRRAKEDTGPVAADADRAREGDRVLEGREAVEGGADARRVEFGERDEAPGKLDAGHLDRRVLVPHPVQDRTDDELRGLADEYFDAILKLLVK